MELMTRKGRSVRSTEGYIGIESARLGRARLWHDKKSQHIGNL